MTHFEYMYPLKLLVKRRKWSDVAIPKLSSVLCKLTLRKKCSIAIPELGDLNKNLVSNNLRQPITESKV